MAHDVFISYSRKDPEIAERITEELDKYGITYFIDKVEINVGEDYAGVIAEAIEQCEIFLFVWSKNSNLSKETAKEISVAMHYEKSMFSFKIGTFRDSPNLIYHLNSIHVIETTVFNDPKVIELGKKVAKQLGRQYKHETLTTSVNDDDSVLKPIEFGKKIVEQLQKQQDIHTTTTQSDDENSFKSNELAEESSKKLEKQCAEENKKKLIAKTRETRHSFALLIDQNDSVDNFHLYKEIKRIDICDFETGVYSSYRWITIQNVCEFSTYSIQHRECGENKVTFEEMKIRAKEIRNGEKEDIVCCSCTPIQPNFIQNVKLYFSKPLQPQDIITIFYRLDWPGDVKYLSENEMSEGISLSRYPRGVEKLIFGVLASIPLFGIEIEAVDDMFQEFSPEATSEHIRIQDDIDLKPLHKMTLSGAYFTISKIDNIQALRIYFKKRVIAHENSECEF